MAVLWEGMDDHVKEPLIYLAFAGSSTNVRDAGR